MFRTITLTTDFGTDSPYVAAMKGVIWSIHPEVRVVDLTHAIPPQDVHQGAWVLDETLKWFPSDTLHLAVVDPGVGTQRALIYAQLGEHHCLAPDNGLLSRLARRNPIRTIRALTDSSWWRSPVSRTFHGRDILAPVAAHLSLGLDPARLGPARSGIVELPWPEVLIVPGKIVGSIRSIDSFGNLITDIPAAALADAPRDERLRIECDEHETLGLQATYGDQPPMTFMALIGSSGFLELAIVNDNASEMLGVRVGAPVTARWT